MSASCETLEMKTLETIRRQWGQIQDLFTERMRRQWAASEAVSLGRGGRDLVVRATELASSTVSCQMAGLS